MRVLLLENINQVGMKNDNSQSWWEGKDDRKEGMKNKGKRRVQS